MLFSVMLFSVLNGGDLSRLMQRPPVLQDLRFTVEVSSHDRDTDNYTIDSYHFLIQLIH